MTSNRNRMPPFASGRIVADYNPLFRYWEEARRKGREDLLEMAMLREEDYRMLRELVEGRRMALADLLDEVRERLLDRIDPDLAAEVLAGTGLSATAPQAREFLASILAGWLVEAGEYWGIIVLRGA